LEAYIYSTAKLLDAGNYPPSQVKPPRFRIYLSLNKTIAQFGIQFIQIGNDREATAYLDKLDDDRDERKRKRLSFWSKKPKQRAARVSELQTWVKASTYMATIRISLIPQNQSPTASLTANIWQKHFSEVFTAGLIEREREG